MNNANSPSQLKAEPSSVFFHVEQDKNGNPPITREEVWCIHKDGDRYIVDNIPFYARDISMGDEINTEIRNGERWFQAVTAPSKNTTVRVYARNPMTASTLLPLIHSFGGLTEKMEDSPLIAINFPPSADIAAAMEYLDRESEAGNLAFEESSVRYRT